MSTSTRQTPPERAAGLRPAQIWVPDTRAPDFAAKCRVQALAVAANDPCGDDIWDWIEAVNDWPLA